MRSYSRKGDLWSQKVRSHRLHGLHRFCRPVAEGGIFRVPVGALFSCLARKKLGDFLEVSGISRIFAA